MQQQDDVLPVLDTEACWDALVRRDRSADGTFVYAVETTGIYCRPSCASRVPRRENVRFFALPAAAERHGCRPCKRCRPERAELTHPRAKLVQAVAEYVAGHAAQPEAVALSALGETFGYDPQHLQRLFRDALGLTPRQYADGLRAQRFRHELRGGGGVLEAGLEAGYGSASRTYDTGGRALGMTPAAYRRGGAGVNVRYTVVTGEMGSMLAAATEKGVCAVGLYDSETEAEAALRSEFPNADITRDDGLHGVVADVLAHITHGTALDIPLDIQATAFQMRVWRALQAIPRGETRSYTQIAEAIGEPAAVRAVAGACAANQVAVIIPCHRVIKSDGGISGYRWGPERKRQILAAERE